MAIILPGLSHPEMRIPILAGKTDAGTSSLERHVVFGVRHECTDIQFHLNTRNTLHCPSGIVSQ